MRCCASPTTSTAADTRPGAPSRPDAIPTLRRAQEKDGPEAIAAAVLFREILKPLAQGLGPVGEVALGAVADDLFVRKRR